MGTRRVAAIAFAMLVTGCTHVGPDYVRPKATFPPAFIEPGPWRRPRRAMNPFAENGGKFMPIRYSTGWKSKPGRLALACKQPRREWRRLAPCWVSTRQGLIPPSIFLQTHRVIAYRAIVPTSRKKYRAITNTRRTASV